MLISHKSKKKLSLLKGNFRPIKVTQFLDSAKIGNIFVSTRQILLRIITAYFIDTFRHLFSKNCKILSLKNIVILWAWEHSIGPYTMISLNALIPYVIVSFRHTSYQISSENKPFIFSHFEWQFKLCIITID